MVNKVIIPGGSGFLGAALARRLRERGREVVVLTRGKPRRRGDGIREVYWDGRTIGPWAQELEGALAIVNLAGRSIDCVHSPENRRQILQTRLSATSVLAKAVAACAQPPTVWVQASAIGIYGHTGERRCDETAAAGTDFLADVCRQNEAEFASGCPAAVRSVVVRIGLVLGRRDGVFPRLDAAVRWFVGGTAGNGRQGMSWIHLTDWEEILLKLIDDPACRGVYNACAPEPASNAEFMRTLRSARHRPWCPPAPALLFSLLVRYVLRTEPSLVLEGQFALPARLTAEGFAFRYPVLARALSDLTHRS